MSRFNVTVQFPDRAAYTRLQVLAKCMGSSMGATISQLVEEDIQERGIRLGKELDKKPKVAK